MILGVLSACGGKVFVDLPGSAGGGGGGGAGGTGATSPTASTGSGMTCDDLVVQLEAAIEAARACNPAISSIQCDGTAIVPDACDCPVLLNEKQPGAVGAAKSAYQAASEAGCLLDCDAPCAQVGPGFCQPSPTGSSGVCNVAFPD